MPGFTFFYHQVYIPYMSRFSTICLHSFFIQSTSEYYEFLRQICQNRDVCILIICIPDRVNIYHGPDECVTPTSTSKLNMSSLSSLTAMLDIICNWQCSVWSRLWEREGWRTIILYVLKRSGIVEERLSKRDQRRSTHRSTSEGFVDPRYYQLSELTGYTYFTRQSTCHVLTALGFAYEPKFLHEAPWAPRCFASLDEVLSLNTRWMPSAKLIWGIFFCALTKATRLVLVSIPDDRSLGCSVCPGVGPPAADSKGFVQVSELHIAEASAS